jgi:uncharacterized membrane protein
MKRSTKDWLLFGLSLCLFIFFIALHGHAVFSDIDRLPWRILVPVTASFVLAHSWYLLGWRRALLLMGCATLISFAAETLGQSRGWLFGPYCYTELLGPKIDGRIPLLIPFAWYMMFYPSYVIANLVAEGRATAGNGRFVWILWMALLSAAIMTAWDLTMDPIMSYEPLDVVDQATIAASGEIPAWRWLVSVVEPQNCSAGARLPPTTSTHFGVPWQNYQGWMLTAFVVFLVYRLLERRLPLHRERAPHDARALARLTAIMPVTGYMAMALIDAILGSPRIQDVHLISPFAMGITAAVAAVAIFRGQFTLHEAPASASDPSG